MIKNLIEKFGGLTEMSLKTGVPISTIQYWQNVNKIPSWRLRYIGEKAAENGIFFDIETFSNDEIKKK
jgi:hypothetical protein